MITEILSNLEPSTAIRSHGSENRYYRSVNRVDMSKRT